MDMNEHIEFGSLDWTSPATGVREKAVDVGPLRYRIVEFTPEFVEDGWCERGHIGYMIEGELEIKFADHTIRLSKGDGLFIPGGEESKHRAKALSSVARILLVDEGSPD